MIEWSKLTPTKFEQLCYFLMESQGFDEMKWYGQTGSDKGRDLVGHKISHPITGIAVNEKWVIQCKRYIKQPSKSELYELFHSVREHNPDYVLLALTTTLTANLKDWLGAISNEFPFKITYWEENDLLREISKNHDTLSKLGFPLRAEKKKLLYYPANRNEFRFLIDGLDEIEIIAFNCDSLEEAEAKIERFFDNISNKNAEYWK